MIPQEEVRRCFDSYFLVFIYKTAGILNVDACNLCQICSIEMKASESFSIQFTAWHETTSHPTYLQITERPLRPITEINPSAKPTIVAVFLQPAILFVYPKTREIVQDMRLSRVCKNVHRVR
jgi:hypothetical protein